MCKEQEDNYSSLVRLSYKQFYTCGLMPGGTSSREELEEGRLMGKEITDNQLMLFAFAARTL